MRGRPEADVQMCRTTTHTHQKIHTHTEHNNNDAAIAALRHDHRQVRLDESLAARGHDAGVRGREVVASGERRATGSLACSESRFTTRLPAGSRRGSLAAGPSSDPVVAMMPLSILCT